MKKSTELLQGIESLQVNEADIQKTFGMDLKSLYLVSERKAVLAGLTGNEDANVVEKYLDSFYQSFMLHLNSFLRNPSTMSAETLLTRMHMLQDFNLSDSGYQLKAEVKQRLEEKLNSESAGV